MVQVIRARDMGFCFGVRRAVQMMEDAVQDLGEMASLGSVVHNPQVVESLQRDGVTVVSDYTAMPERPIAITAHGVSPDVIARLEERGTPIVDTTCPIVTRSQQWAKRLSEEGFAVIIFGDPRHKEVRGVVGWGGSKVLVIPRAEQIVPLPEDFPSRVAVLAQTTETSGRFVSFVSRLLSVNMDHISELRVINTLCHATTSQQAATIELAAMVDLMIVVGGRESANTRHLADVSRECGVETFQIESADEVHADTLRGHERIGVTAGASTPDAAIDAVVARVEQLTTGQSPVAANGNSKHAHPIASGEQTKA